jgi:predicted transcriptional regulator
MNVTQLSRALSLSSQEASRHLSRLNTTGVTRKDVDGTYHLTLYGTLILHQIRGMDFASRHAHYFNDHTLDAVPAPFIHRIGELIASTYIDDIMVVFTNIETVIRNAEDYLWIITDQYLPSNMPLHVAAWERGVKERDIELTSWVVPERIRESVPNREEYTKKIHHARTTGIVEERMLNQLNVHLCMSEKEVAVVAFPLIDGRFDYFGFSSTDEQTRAWCRDIFNYYWECAYPRLKLADELFWWLKQQPAIIPVFKQIAQRETVIHNEMISVLEEKSLIKGGQLTILGEHVYHRLLNS